MSKHNKHKELVPFKIVFTVLFIGGGAWAGKFFYDQHKQGLSLSEAAQKLKGSAEEAYIEYEAFVEEKIPLEAEDTPEELAAKAAAHEARADKISLKSFGLEEMRKLIVRAGAEDTAPMLMTDVKHYQLLAIRAVQNKSLDEAESYLSKARKLLQEAEKKNLVIKQAVMLKERFDNMVDPEGEALIKLHVKEEGAPVLHALEISREGWGNEAEEAAMIYDAAILVYSQLLDTAMAKQVDLELYETRLAFENAVGEQNFKEARAQLSVMEQKGRSVKELLTMAQKVVPALPEGERNIRCSISDSCSVGLVWVPEEEGHGFWMAEKETDWEMYWTLFPKASKSGRRAKFPVRDVSWFGANTFCKVLSKHWGVAVKLPREHEWERACAAGKETRYSFGDEVSDLAQHGNFADKKSGLPWANTEYNDGYKALAPCGTFKPNPWGIWDMHGNVMEWTRSFYEKRREGAAKDNPIVVRGGSWHYGPELCETKQRYRYLPEMASNDIGFRFTVRL